MQNPNFTAAELNEMFAESVTEDQQLDETELKFNNDVSNYLEYGTTWVPSRKQKSPKHHKKAAAWWEAHAKTRTDKSERDASNTRAGDHYESHDEMKGK